MDAPTDAAFRASFLSQILDNALDGVITFDGRGVIVDMNRAARRLCGLPETSEDRPRPDLTLPIESLLPARYRRRFNERLAAFGARYFVRSRRVQLCILSAHGVEFPVEVSVNEAPGSSMYVAFIRDISGRMRIKRSLLSYREQAMHAAGVKAEFLANMSHEIRTPLNAVMGMAGLLSETPLSEDQRRFVAMCRRSSRALLRIIDDILDLSKSETGQLMIKEVRFDLGELLESVTESMAIRAHEKGLKITLRVRPSTPRFMKGDPARLRQILTNLIGNAVKFTPAGEIRFTVDRTIPEGEVPPMLVFTVRDTGIGIAAPQIPRIFEKFTQADSSMTRKYGGTGLGLTLCKRLIEEMGGQIMVTSREGWGSEFRVLLPLEGSVDAPSLQPRSLFLDLRGKSALVLGPASSGRSTLNDLLRGWGALVRELSDVRELSQAEPLSEHFDLVFVVCEDQHLVEETASVLRRRWPAARLICAGHELTRERGSWVGRLSRPIRPSEVMRQIRFALGLSDASEDFSPEELIHETGKPHIPPVSVIESDGKSGPRVLIVEDSADNQALIRAYLHASPFSLTVAANGAEACEAFRHENFDLVLMDMQMPVMDGYNATREIRRLENESGRERTPIVALTAHALSEEIKKSMDAGCDGHLSKPVRKRQLIDAIEMFLNSGGSDGPRTRGADVTIVQRRKPDDVGRETRP